MKWPPLTLEAGVGFTHSDPEHSGSGDPTPVGRSPSRSEALDFPKVVHVIPFKVSQCFSREASRFYESPSPSNVVVGQSPPAAKRRNSNSPISPASERLKAVHRRYMGFQPNP